MTMYWSERYAGGKWVKVHANGVVTCGAAEPVLSVLDVQGFAVEDLFLIGTNESCGAIVLPTESRAGNAAAALEPAYRTKVSRTASGDWEVKYDRRELDGSVGSHLITDLVLKDGRTLIKDGRWII
jgi:hypothetical protein